MKRETLRGVREFLGMSQKELAGYLGISAKAIQSYEQGWRKVPDHIEKFLLFYLAKIGRKEKAHEGKCWRVRNCSDRRRTRCLATALGAGEECWFVTGNVSRGARKERWREKRKICFACRVFRRHMRFLKGTPLYKQIVESA